MFGLLQVRGRRADELRFVVGLDKQRDGVADKRFSFASVATCSRRG